MNDYSISYPGNWVVQDPTPLMDFNFRAVCETGFPNLTIHVDDVLENGLKESLKRACHFFSTSLGMDAVLISEIQTSLNDGSSAIEGEIELHSPNMFHQLVILVLLAQKGNRIVRISLGSFMFQYKDLMRQKLRDIAYTLTFG